MVRKYQYLLHTFSTTSQSTPSQSSVFPDQGSHVALLPHLLPRLHCLNRGPVGLSPRNPSLGYATVFSSQLWWCGQLLLVPERYAEARNECLKFLNSCSIALISSKPAITHSMNRPEGLSIHGFQ